MINPGWEHVIRCAYDDLAPGGLFTVVDFHDSTQPLFKWWMRENHVRMDGHLLPELTSKCKSETVEIHKAYIGMWEYLLFIGQKVPVEIL
jgi:S-adenosylmethionine-diacylgycerolhomoserine-N-methlytransferase